MLMSMEEKKDQIELLEDLFALSRDAVLGVRDGCAVFCNEAARRLFGREVRGAAVSELLPELAALPLGESAVTAAEAAGAVYTVTAVPQGDVTVLTLLPPEQDPGALGASVLSPLRMSAFRLRMSLDALAERAGEGEDVRRAFHSYFELLHRIEQLSDAGMLSRKELGFRLQPVELGRLVRDLTDSVAFFASRRASELSCAVPEEPCLVWADSQRLEELLLILLSNALKSTPEGGRIRVSLRRDGERFHLSVEDDGAGMSPRELSCAFSLREDAEPSDAASGPGLGLYIAQGIARLHGGTVLLRSRPGQGTRVTVSLPDAPGLRVRDLAPAPAVGAGRILTDLADLLPNDMYDEKYRD